MKLFLVLNRLSHSFALLTPEISWSTLEIKFIYFCTSMCYLSLYIFIIGYIPRLRYICCLDPRGPKGRGMPIKTTSDIPRARHEVYN